MANDDVRHRISAIIQACVTSTLGPSVQSTLFAEELTERVMGEVKEAQERGRLAGLEEATVIARDTLKMMSCARLRRLREAIRARQSAGGEAGKE